MEGIKTIEEVREQIEPEEEKVEEVSFNDLKYEGSKGKDLVFRHKGHTYILGPNLASVLCSRVGVPYGFLLECPEELRGRILSTFLGKEEARIKIVSTKERTLGFLPTKYPYVPLVKIFDVACSETPGAGVALCKVDGLYYTFDLVSEVGMEPPKKVGDITRAGVTIQTERVGYLPLGLRYKVGGFFYRLSCSNGAITRYERFSGVSGQSEDAILEGIRGLTKQAFNEVKEKHLPEFIHLDQVRASDPTALVHRVSRDRNLSGRIEGRLLDRLPEIGCTPSVYDVVNLITSTANEYEKLEQRRSLQELGGLVTISAEHRCPTCKTHLSG